jgi:hypothetical protein
MPNKRILLLEPGYKNKYPPLGLMKIAQYHGPYGKQDQVTFAKGPDARLTMKAWDRVYNTTLFSFEYQKIAETIDFAVEAVHGQSQRVFVGGINGGRGAWHQNRRGRAPDQGVRCAEAQGRRTGRRSSRRRPRDLQRPVSHGHDWPRSAGALASTRSGSLRRRSAVHRRALSALRRH